jgi:hypothetical protein
MTHVSVQARQRFAFLKRKFFASTFVPAKRRSWRSISANEIWLRVFCQVVEVGRSDPSATLRENPKLRRRIAFSRLDQLTPNQRSVVIHSVLRDIGARYCSRRRQDCRKTAALAENFNALRTHPGGPRGFLRDVMAITGRDASDQRITFVTSRLSYIKNKGARDLLTTGWRVADAYLAFDIRWQNALKRIGVAMPPGTLTAPARYAKFERLLISRVAQPLGLSGKQLDQLIFNNYEAILDSPWRSA